MAAWRPVLLAAACLLLAPPPARPARILGAFGHVGKSHWDVFEPLMRELAARGHGVTVISHFPQEKPLANYTDISLRGTQTHFSPVGQVDVTQQRVRNLWDVWQQHQMLASLALGGCEAAFAHPEVQQLLHSNSSFDLLITELFTTDCFLALAHHFKVPHIAMSSCLLMPWAHDRFGNAHNPSYEPNILHDVGVRMGLWERLRNAAYTALDIAIYNLLYDAPAERLTRRFFGAELPPLRELAKNASMVFVNSHPVLTHARSHVPAVLEVAGIHLPPPSPLPKELQAFLDGGAGGVVYFNMGSMVRATSLPASARQAFLTAFGRLGLRVLWKWEEDGMPGQPDNVKTSKWLPQAQVLRHPNVRVYIGHGGLLGSIEAASAGVPMVVIPIFGDQRANVRNLQLAGMARRLELEDVTADSVYEAVSEVLLDNRYRASAQRIARVLRDRPQPPLAAAVFWTEFVIRHRGAPHLRNAAAAALPWHQRCLLDAAALALALVAAAVVLAALVARALRALARRAASAWALSGKLKGD